MNISLIKSMLQNRIFWYLFSRYFSLALQFFASIFIAVRLDVYYFGIWSFMFLLINIGSACNWGIGHAATILLVQHKEDKKLCDSYIFNSFLLVILSSVIPLGVMIFDRVSGGLEVFQKYHLGNFIYAVTAVVILQYLCNFFINLFRVKNRIIEIIIQQSLWPLVMMSLVFCATGKTLLNLLAFGYVFALSFAVGIFIVFFRLNLRAGLNISVTRQILSKGFFLFLYNACFLAIMLSTKFLVSYFYSVAEFGYFSFAFSLAQGVMLLIDSLIFLVFPKMIDMLKGSDTEQIRSAIKVLRDNYLLPLHLVFYMILSISVPFFYFMPQYSKSFLPFVLILFTLVMYSNCFGYNSYLLAQNREKSFSLIVLTALVLNILLTWMLICVFCVRFEYVVLGTLLVYLLYSLSVNCYALYCIGARKWMDYARENLFTVANAVYIIGLGVIILFNCHWWIFIGMFIAFVLLHISQLRKLAINAVKLIRNDCLINV